VYYASRRTNNGVIGNRPKQVEARGHRRRRDCKMTALLYGRKPGKMRLGPDAWRRKVPSMSPMEKTLYEEDHD